MKIYKVNTEFGIRYSIGDFGELTNYVDSSGCRLRVGDVCSTNMYGKQTLSVVVNDKDCGFSLFGFAEADLYELKATKVTNIDKWYEVYKGSRYYVLYEEEVSLTMFIHGLLGGKKLNDDFLWEITRPRVRKHFREYEEERQKLEEEEGSKLWGGLVDLFRK